jgi:cob(I)alamin adenosyltransferase
LTEPESDTFANAIQPSRLVVKIYTKTGDAGDTSLFDGTRVSKADPRVAAYGDVDELQACIGVVRAAGLPDDLNQMCVTIQRDLFALGARLADPSHKIAKRVEKIVINDESVTKLENWIDALDAELPPLRHFILSDGQQTGAALHLARTVCRRAERAVLSLGKDAVDGVVLIYLNRLSDLLFTMARAANHRANSPETPW